MGKTDAGESTDNTNSVMSLHVNDAKISDLWRLDTLGILDPGEKGTSKNLRRPQKNISTENVPHNFEKTATLLLESFYVDNCVTSVDDHEELEKFIEESKTILSTAKFELRGWEHSYSDPQSYDLYHQKEKSISVLGLRWHLKTDSLTIDLRDCVEDDTPVTKKEKILSTVHKIFDPLGFTCPVTLSPKVLLQECWKLKVS
ncbi:integrase catalytic domain-containing protein [Trichonephila inaurata madagascariensis]|uniref:Integrase catalytic domain-containing protein n=1 Tax=Trichonephila inaurata madagascariensis TaxID=2747483 RepID=A0A8X6YBJ5_9ARAC|nr:integrase catalytic domain-containing protein [Trichonephila inaurata madagascariensis]